MGEGKKNQKWLGPNEAICKNSEERRETEAKNNF